MDEDIQDRLLFNSLLFIYLSICIDTREVSGHVEAEFFRQIPTAKALERKHSRHERGVLYIRPCPPAIESDIKQI